MYTHVHTRTHTIHNTHIHREGERNTEREIKIELGKKSYREEEKARWHAKGCI